MPSVIQLRERLLKKLKQLFQLDQPDLWLLPDYACQVPTSIRIH